MTMMDMPASPAAAPQSFNTGSIAATLAAMTPVRGAAEADPSRTNDFGRPLQQAMTVRALFQQARDAKRQLVQQWKKNYKVLNGKTWTQRAEPWMPAPEMPNIWPLLASMVAWMTDQRPAIETVASMPPFSAEADYYDKLSEHMNAVLSSNFRVNSLDAEVEKCLWDVGTYGIGYTKTVWEPWLADGHGDSVFRRVDPYMLYPDPYAKDMNSLNYIIEAKIMSMTDLDRAWPGALKAVPSWGNYEDIDEAPHKTDGVTNLRSPRVNLAPLGTSDGGSGTPNSYTNNWQTSHRGVAGSVIMREDPTVVVLECWTRCHEIDTEGMVDGTARVTDRWKCTVVCGSTILMDKYADEIYGFPTHPYDKMTMFDTGEWYGPALVEFLTSPQESINRLLASIEQNILLHGNPILLQSVRARNRMLTNRPGQRVEGTTADTAWLDPPTIHPDIVKLIEYYENKLQEISGLSAIMRGFSPTGRNSSDVLSSVQDSAFVRVRATLRNLERLLRSAAQKMTGNIAEFYTEPRMVAVAGQGDDKHMLPLKAQHFYHTAASGSRDPVPLRFQIVAEAGSERPTSRGARAAEADTLYAMGAIDVIEVLKAHAWPNSGEVAGRVMDMQAINGTLGQPPGARQRTQRAA